MAATVLCPECEGELSIESPMIGEIMPCPSCGADLEVTSVEPLKLELAPEVQEDWGE